MNANNRVLLTGNLGKDPEIKTFDNGNKLAKFSLATREEYTTRSGEKNTETQWHYVSAWGKLADRIESEFRKGSFVSIEGKLKTRNYTDSSGQKRYITEIVANDAVLKSRSDA